MSDHQTEMALLKHIVHGGDSDECRKLEKSIAQVQHDRRCVQRLASVTAQIFLLAIAGMAYGVLLQQDFPSNGSELVFAVLCVLILASLICLVTFAGLLTVYFKKLIRLRKEARQLLTRLLE